MGDDTPATSLTLPDAASLVGILRAHLPALTAQYRIKSLGLFGSYVRREQKPTSDLDILVENVATDARSKRSPLFLLVHRLTARRQNILSRSIPEAHNLREHLVWWHDRLKT